MSGHGCVDQSAFSRPPIGGLSVAATPPPSRPQSAGQAVSGSSPGPVTGDPDPAQTVPRPEAGDEHRPRDDDRRWREERENDKRARHEGPDEWPMMDERALDDNHRAAPRHDDHAAVPGVSSPGHQRQGSGQDEGERKTSAHGEPPSGRRTPGSLLSRLATEPGVT